jgi:hypothetical protein
VATSPGFDSLPVKIVGLSRNGGVAVEAPLARSLCPSEGLLEPRDLS